MSQQDPAAAAPAKVVTISARHYEALCGLALAAIFLVQLQQSSTTVPVTLLANLIVVFIGVLGILYRVRLSPIFVLLALAAPHLIDQYNNNQLFAQGGRGFRLDVADLLLSVAMLTYLIGQYRLQGLRFGLLPNDPRQTVEQQARSQASLSAAEMVGLIFPVPMFALLAEFAVLLLREEDKIINVESHYHQFLSVTWGVLLALFVGAQAFRFWRRQQMDQFSAQLLLQDALWSETRGEQRRINRWLVWKKLH